MDSGILHVFAVVSTAVLLLRNAMLYAVVMCVCVCLSHSCIAIDRCSLPGNYTLVGCTIWLILREAALHGPSALADILVDILMLKFVC